MVHLKVIATITFLSTWTTGHIQTLQDVVMWDRLEFSFVREKDRLHAVANGFYAPNNATPIDVDVNYRPNGKMRLFVTVPRMKLGIPYTLATVTKREGPLGPYLKPYPDYDMHFLHNCDGIISAFRIAIDECNRMWVLDSGVNVNAHVCPPQLLLFDLKTDKLLHRYQFEKEMYPESSSIFITPIVDISDPPPKGRCLKAMVYIADVHDPGLVVYDSEQKTAWRIENDLMRPELEWSTHTIGGQTFFLMDGIFAINLTPRKDRFNPNAEFGATRRGKRDLHGERNLYFHAMASDKENVVPLNLVNNRTIWENNPKAMPEAFQTLGERGIQSPMEAVDSKGNMFANTHNANIFVWNINTPYKNESFRVVANNPAQLQFASGMKVVMDPKGHEVLWVFTIRLQKVVNRSPNPFVPNYRIMACKTNDLLRQMPCIVHTDLE